MPPPHNHPDLFGFDTAPASLENQGAESERWLDVTLTLSDHSASFHWFEGSSKTILARGVVDCDSEFILGRYAVRWVLKVAGRSIEERGTFNASSVHACLRSWRKLLPVADANIRLLFENDPSPLPLGLQPWKHLGTAVYRLLEPVHDLARSRWRAAAASGPAGTEWRLQVECYPDAFVLGLVWVRWLNPEDQFTVRVRLEDPRRFEWVEGTVPDLKQRSFTRIDEAAIRTKVETLIRQRPVAPQDAIALWITLDQGGKETVSSRRIPVTSDGVVGYIVSEIIELRDASLPAMRDVGVARRAFEIAGAEGYGQSPERLARRAQREQERAEAARLERHERMERLAIANRMKQRERERTRREAEIARAREESQKVPAPVRPRTEPLPPVPVHFELPPLVFQETALLLTDLQPFLLVERAAMWWVSNQSDDLLCLPHCRVERLEYQIRTALRVLGPLRGRALLSDEVGLGKTIEAGLVLKELVTRGLARRALILTVPSLVDQWEEELAEKFSLQAATTNHAAARAEGTNFWGRHPLIVASLHTLKQTAQLAAAREVAWDCLIVDEAHHLRNRDSQAWRAVSALPRQFMLLLTATPVQNSLEELYNLVTLLQPGQFPSPREFRARHMDPKRPRQPRQPNELRRLLGQVMVRNTRASSGIELPPRRAETVLFDPDSAEKEFWNEWNRELRDALDRLPAAQSNLWGRLLLQAAGSSPAAWQAALEKFPDAGLVRKWRDRALLEASWQRKCALLTPLIRGAGGCVIFTQFLDTQAALVETLGVQGIATVSINGSTPAVDRQPLVERFRRDGGALLLSRSGTEGRNLQFCHRLVNFDLPWNPMEIEQRIGRLHRLGQAHPVSIFNLVQRDTLQEHLLTILQEKLNLFELVVGETGLVLGEKFSADEFAEEVLRRWRSGGDDVAASFAALGDELAAARAAYGEVKALDETLFAQDYQTD